MRIKVALKLKRLPILYRHRFIALTKEALKSADENYKDSLYPDRTAVQSKKTKPFTFSVFIPPGFTKKKEKFFIDENLQIEDTVLYPSDGQEISLFISSSDYQFIINLYNGLLKIDSFKMTDFINDDGTKEEVQLQVGRVFLLNEKRISEPVARFKTLSPISVEDERDRPIDIFAKDGKTINNDELARFTEHLNAIQDRRLKDLRGYSLKRPIKFIPIDLKRKGIKHTLKGFREQTGKPYMVLTTYQGTFCLEGDPEDLQFIYLSGLGLRTGQGFGMVDLV
ncbi:MAG: CRISPR-associated endoribonuclease Cas6 [Nitrospirae bacterium]|nr:MAG: CRISPR-associated endoribonuclease Cas6 [Nitrospirota bacterium]